MTPADVLARVFPDAELERNPRNVRHLCGRFRIRDGAAEVTHLYLMPGAYARCFHDRAATVGRAE